MLVGYVRVSKSDGSQTLAPQRDAAEVRSLLSRYRHGLSAGRTDGQTGDEPSSGGTVGDPTLPPPYYPDSPGGHEQ